MRVRFLRGTSLGGVGNDAAPGDERDLPEVQAAQLIMQGRATPIPAESVTAKALAPVSETPVVETPLAATTMKQKVKRFLHASG